MTMSSQTVSLLIKLFIYCFEHKVTFSPVSVLAGCGPRSNTGAPTHPTQEELRNKTRSKVVTLLRWRQLRRDKLPYSCQAKTELNKRKH